MELELDMRQIDAQVMAGVLPGHMHSRELPWTPHWARLRDESVDGDYGGVAFRCNDRRYWKCTDSDYTWWAVIDDFGNLACISGYINNRGY